MTKKSFWSKIELPKNTVDEKLPFAFDLYRTKYDGVVFLITGLLIPFLALLCFRFFGQMGVRPVDDPVNTWLTLGSLLVNIVCCGVGIYYFYQKDPQLFIKSGLFIFYAFQIFPLLIVLVFSPVGNLLTKNKEVTALFSMWLQIIAEVIIIVFALIWTVDLKERIGLTLKTSWKQLLLVAVGGAVLMWLVALFYALIFENTALGGESSNQRGLIELLQSENFAIKISAVVSLITLTVVVAPLAEELSARQAWFIGSGNRTIGWITSAIFFGMIHVSSGDVEHIFSYFIGGLVLATVFSIARGNVTHSWLVHLGYNGITLMIVLIRNLN